MDEAKWCPSNKAGEHDWYETRGGVFRCANCGHRQKPAAIAAKRQKEGIARAVRSSGEDWVEYALGFMERYARSHETVFCDDVWAAGLERPVSPRAFGQVMKKAIKLGWIRTTDKARPSHQSNNSLRMVYESLIYEGAANA